MKKMFNNIIATFILIFCSNFIKSLPNIIIILADDLGWNDVSYHGSEIKTPNIDKMIISGIELDRFYVQPTCSPTRAELMTGKSALRLGITRPISKNQKLGLSLEEKILPEYLKELGYKNYLLGKWHLGAYTPDYFPTRRGFDYFYGYLQGGIGYWDHNHGGGHDWQRNEEGIREDGYTTHLIRDDAVKIIERHDGKSPLFLNINFGAPHTPNEAPYESIDKYSEILDEKRKIHAAMVSEMDQAIGSIIQSLEEPNIIDNTIILFASDNGGLIPNNEIRPNFLNLPNKLGMCNWERPLSVDVLEWLCSNFDGGSSNFPLQKGKMSISEGGIRVPAVIWWPNELEGKKSELFISMIDVMPTLLELVGYKKNLVTDGRSKIDDLFEKGQTEPTKYSVINVVGDATAIIDIPYKLILYSDEIYLFNIMEDPLETNNIIADNRNIADSLKRKLIDWPKGENRSLPLTEVLKDPDLFGGPENRIPWIEKAFQNSENQ